MISPLGGSLDGRYEIHEELGRGGMGVVFRARHLALDQSVAIKVLPTDKDCDPVSIQRFIREARRSFKIDHPNCVRVLDFGSSDSGFYMVMEYLDGRTISDEIRIDGPLDSKRVSHIAHQVALGLGHAHSHGLVHRDLKPLNIMLLQRGNDHDFTKIFDFGLSRLFDAGAIKTALSISPLTQKGLIFGTPEYMSPEQALGEKFGPPADIYALGACCYEMLTGAPPFTGETFMAVLRQQVKDLPRRPSEVRPDLAINPQLESLILSCLLKDASKRPSIPELVEALSPAHTTTPPRLGQQVSSAETIDFSQFALSPAPSPSKAQDRSPKGRIAIGVALLAVVSAGLFLVTQGGTPDKSIKQVAAPAPPTNIDAGAPIDGAVAAVEPQPDASASQPKPQKTNRLRKHLQAAEAARRGKNVLTQLAEANAALRISPRSRRAAFLVGDALMKSGDKVRACKYFRSSSKRDYRVAGCKD